MKGQGQPSGATGRALSSVKGSSVGGCHCPLPGSWPSHYGGDGSQSFLSYEAMVSRGMPGRYLVASTRRGHAPGTAQGSMLIR